MVIHVWAPVLPLHNHRHQTQIQEEGELKRNRVLLIALLMLALVLIPLVAACGGEETTTTTAAATETTVAAAYDISTIVAGIQADTSIVVPDKYKGGVVKVGSDAPYPPWEFFVGETDQFTGFDYDLAQAIGAKLGVKFEFVKTLFDSIVIGIKAGNLDVAMSSMYDKPSRQEEADFVDYAKDGTAMLVLKGNPEGITGFADLAGKNVGCEKGTTQADALASLNEKFKAEGKPEMTVSEFPDQPAALLAVQSGKVVCDLTDSSTGGYIAVTTDDGATFEIVMDPNPPAGWETKLDGIGIGKDNVGLRDAIQKALQALMDDGTYKTIIDHYGIQAIDKATINAGNIE
jgi:polar amino acid transport system substrate-binding protein